MIAALTGIILHKSLEHLIVDVNGVGYELFVPLSTYYELPEEGESVTVNTFLGVSDSALTLFGFLTVDEKNIFIKLKSVSGIGSKLALAILSGITASDLITAIQAKDIAKLTSIPGVGKKTAERLALELKDKLAAIAPSVAALPSAKKDESTVLADDVVSALMNLGYKKNVAESALTKASQDFPEDKTLEKLLKTTLNILSRS